MLKGAFKQHGEASFYRLICQCEGCVAWLHVNWGVGSGIINNSTAWEKNLLLPILLFSCTVLELLWTCSWGCDADSRGGYRQGVVGFSAGYTFGVSRGRLGRRLPQNGLGSKEIQLKPSASSHDYSFRGNNSPAVSKLTVANEEQMTAESAPSDLAPWSLEWDGILKCKRMKMLVYPSC